jgi:hypothetical protein
MVGKLHKSWPGGHVYMLVALNKFTKWVEAAPVTTQDSTAAINFIKSIVFRFDIPYSIITDNGTNFTSKEFKSYCEGLGIKLKFTSCSHGKTHNLDMIILIRSFIPDKHNIETTGLHKQEN